MPVVLIAAFIFTMMYGWKQSDKRLGSDVALTIQKAHRGSVPTGEYTEQYVSKGRLTATELRYPLTECEIQQMNACSVIRKNEVKCRMVRSSFGTSKGQVLLSLSISFDGISMDGHPVSIDMRNKYITAFVVNDKTSGWTLSRISK